MLFPLLVLHRPSTDMSSGQSFLARSRMRTDCCHRIHRPRHTAAKRISRRSNSSLLSHSNSKRVSSNDLQLMQPQHRYGMLVMSCATVFSATPPLLSFLASNTHSTASTALATALNLTLGGGPGLLLGVWIYKPQDAKGGYKKGNWINAAFMVGIFVVCVGLRLWYAMVNKRVEVKRKYVL